MYTKLDQLIVCAVGASRQAPMYDRLVAAEGGRIAAETGRDAMRVIDGRTQALRRAGRIAYYNKGQAPDGKAGWYLPANYNSTPYVSLSPQPNLADYGLRRVKVLAETRGCSDRAAYPVSLILQRFLVSRGLGYGWMVTRQVGWCKAAASGRVTAPAPAGRGARQAPPARVGAAHRGGVRRVDSALHSRQWQAASATGRPAAMPPTAAVPKPVARVGATYDYAHDLGHPRRGDLRLCSRLGSHAQGRPAAMFPA